MSYPAGYVTTLNNTASNNMPRRRRISSPHNDLWHHRQRLLFLFLFLGLTSLPQVSSEDSSSSKSSFHILYNITDSSFGGGPVSLFLLSFFLCSIGYAFLLYPFLFVPRHRDDIISFITAPETESSQGLLIRSRRGRVFNPLRLVCPARYYWYVLVEYRPSCDPGRDGDNTIRKEICLPEAGYVRLRLTVDSSGYVTIYTDPRYPYSGCLDVAYQCAELSKPMTFIFAGGGMSLVLLGFVFSFFGNRQVLFHEGGVVLWVVILLCHVACVGLAYGGCVFVNRNRMEDLMYETSPAPVEHSLCGNEDVVEETPGKRDGGGVEMAEKGNVNITGVGGEKEPTSLYEAMV